MRAERRIHFSRKIEVFKIEKQAEICNDSDCQHSLSQAALFFTGTDNQTGCIVQNDRDDDQREGLGSAEQIENQTEYQQNIIACSAADIIEKDDGRQKIKQKQNA